GTDGLRIVQIKLHRRMTLDGEEHIGEPPRDMRTDRFTLESADEQGALRLLDRDNEMIAPEPHQSFAERFAGLEAMEKTRGHLAQIGLSRLHEERLEGFLILRLSSLLLLHKLGGE